MATMPEESTPGPTEPPPSPSNDDASAILEPEDPTPPVFSFHRRTRTRYNQSQVIRLNELIFTLGCCRGGFVVEKAIRDIWLKVPESRGGGQGIDLTPPQIIHYVKSRGKGVQDKKKRLEQFLIWANRQPEKMADYSAGEPKNLLSSPPTMSYSVAKPSVSELSITTPTRPRRWPYEDPSPTPGDLTQQTAEFNREASSAHSHQSLEKNDSNRFQGIENVPKPAIDYPTSPSTAPLKGPRFTPIQALQNPSSPYNAREQLSGIQLPPIQDITNLAGATRPVWSPGPKLPPISTLHPITPLPPMRAPPERLTSPQVPSLRLASEQRNIGKPSTASDAPSNTALATVAPAPDAATPANEATRRRQTHIFLLKIRPTETTLDYLAMTPGMIIFNLVPGGTQDEGFIKYEVIVAEEDVAGYLLKTPGMVSMKFKSRMRNM